MAKHSHNSNQRVSPEKVREALGRAFWKIASNYELTRAEQAAILGIKANNQRLGSMEENREIPDDPDKVLRASHLVGIHKSLRILFPQNREVVYHWLKTKRELFKGKSAMEYIMEGDPSVSIMRLYSVRRLLDQLRVA